MKRLSWGFITILGCGVANEPAPDATESRALSDFDPAHYEILSIDEVEAREVNVEVEGELVELSSVADADWAVLPRDTQLPLAEADEAAPNASVDDVGLSSGGGLHAPCTQMFFKQYEVPVNEFVWTCPPPVKGGGIPICYGAYHVVIHDIACSNSCAACGTVSCHDSTINANVAQPSSDYLVNTDWYHC